MSRIKNFGFAVVGAIAGGAAFADAPKVVTDIAPVHSLVARVMAGAGTPDLILPPGASPHSYAMRPSEARMLSQAEVFVWIGPALTPWMQAPIERLAGDAKHLSLMAVPGTSVLPLREGAGFEGAHDHDHGGHDDHDEHEDHADHKDHDDHGDHDDHAGHGDHVGHDHEEALLESDPHVWLDPRNAQVWLPVIAAELSVLDPENADLYAANAKAAQAELSALEDALMAQLAPIKGQPFVVFHDAYHPFEARFGVEAIAALSPSDAQKPGAARLGEVRALVGEVGVRCGFAEPQMNPQLLGVVGEGQDDFTIATIDPLGVDVPLGPDHYTGLLRNMAAALVGCLDR